MMLVLTKAVRILATSSGSIRRSAVAPTGGCGLSFTRRPAPISAPWRRRDAEASRLPGFSLPFHGDTTAWDIRGQYREVLRKRVTGQARCETSGARKRPRLSSSKSDALSLRSSAVPLRAAPESARPPGRRLLDPVGEQLLHLSLPHLPEAHERRAIPAGGRRVPGLPVRHGRRAHPRQPRHGHLAQPQALPQAEPDGRGAAGGGERA